MPPLTLKKRNAMSKVIQFRLEINVLTSLINIAKEKNADSVVSVELTNRHPYFMKKIDSNGLISHYEKQIFPTPRRQELEPIYVLNGAIFLISTKIILDNKSWYENKCYSYIMPSERSIEIDNPHDLHVADLLLKDHLQ